MYFGLLVSIGNLLQTVDTKQCLSVYRSVGAYQRSTRCSTRMYVYYIFAANPIDREGLFNFNCRSVAILRHYASRVPSIVRYFVLLDRFYLLYLIYRYPIGVIVKSISSIVILLRYYYIVTNFYFDITFLLSQRVLIKLDMVFTSKRSSRQLTTKICKNI